MDAIAYRQFSALENDHFWFRARRRIFVDLIERELSGARTAALLDVGCGVGGMLGPLARFGTVTGLERSRDGVSRCRERGCPRVVSGEATELPFRDASFDVVTFFDVLQHVPDERRALEEARRVLKVGGLLVVSGPAYQFLWSSNDRVVQHVRRYTRGRLRAALCGAGFAAPRVSYFNTLLFPLILPVLLIQKAAERLGVSRPDRTNLGYRMPRAIHEILFRVMASERHLLPRVSLPFGHSLVALVRRGITG